MTTLYEDPWIRCDETTLEIRGYYFPLGTSKLIAYRDIQSMTSRSIAKQMFTLTNALRRLALMRVREQS